jgi:putative ABC transport system ATP-binding protein
MNAVSIVDVVKDYNLDKTIVQALRKVSVTIEEGEFVTIAGPSGSGKSTLLNLIGCLDFPSQGKVIVAGTETSSLKEAGLNKLRSKVIGFIFQSFNLIPVLNVVENIELPLLLHSEIKASERKERVMHFVKAVGLEKQLKQKSGELSGGQRQRVAVARALVTSPKIVLADEPTANLDSVTGIEIIELMHNISRTEGTTFIFSSHDPKVIQKASRVLYLEDGLIKREERL